MAGFDGVTVDEGAAGAEDGAVEGAEENAEDVFCGTEEVSATFDDTTVLSVFWDELLCEVTGLVADEVLVSSELISDEISACSELLPERVSSAEDKTDDEASETLFSVLQPVKQKENNKTNAVRIDIILTSFIMYTSKFSGATFKSSPFI